MNECIVRTDIFDYGPTYQAYRDGSDDEKNAIFHNHLFLKSLQDQGFFSNGNQLTLVADIGCGEGDTIINYLKGIQFEGGIDIRAFDANPEYVGQSNDSGDDSSITTIDENAPVVRNFSIAKQSQIIPLRNYQIKCGNMTQSDLTSLLYTKQELKQSKNRFDLVYISHALYYARRELGAVGITKVLDNVFTNLLSENGIAILFHSSIKPDTVGAICAYHLSLIQDIVPTDEENKMIATDRLISSSCDELGLTYFKIPYKSGLYFSNNFKDYIDIFKNINRYHEIRNNNQALQDLYRLIFV